MGVYEHEHAELGENPNFVKVYSPSEGDECYVAYDDADGVSIDPTNGCQVDVVGGRARVRGTVRGRVEL